MALHRSFLKEVNILCELRELYVDTHSDVCGNSDTFWTVTVMSPQLVYVNNYDLLP